MLSFNTCTYRQIKGFAFAASMCACMFVGCGDVNRGKIIGTWSIDRADTVRKRIDQSPDDGSPDGSLIDTQPDSAVSDSSKMLIRFLGNGILKTTTNLGAVNVEKKGKWKFISFDEKSNSMKLSCLLQNQESEHQVEFLDEVTIKLVPPNMAGTKLKLKFNKQD